jgi:putative thioredoxin
MHDVNNFNEEVITKSHSIPVLVDFWAPWCGACKVLSPTLEILQNRHKGEWQLAKVNVDNHPLIAAQYQTSSIPTVKLFVNGKVVNEFTGAIPGHQIEEWLKKSLPPKSYTAVKHIQELLFKGHDEEAEGLLSDLLKKESENKEIKTLLARSIVLRNPEKARDLIDGIDPVDSIGDLAQAVREISNTMTQFFNQDDLPQSPAKSYFLHAITALYGNNLDMALENLIESIRSDAKYLNEYARKLCIALFKYLGEESSLTQKYRRILGMVLYK